MISKLIKLALACSGIFSLLSAGCSEGKNEARSENPISGFDIVINNGRVMDPETEFDGIRNVGIKDGKIVTITEEKITGKETIAAAGHVVALGFIEGLL